MTVGARVLSVDDSEEFGRALVKLLQRWGLRGDWRDGLEAALKALESESYDLILLDWRLPDVSGSDACRALRSMSPNLPIAVLTISEEVADHVAAFEAGADDCIVKETPLEELRARLDALLRRSDQWNRQAAGRSNAIQPLIYGPLKVDLRSHRVEISGAPVSFTPHEVRFLLVLAEARGQHVSAACMVDAVFDCRPADPAASLRALASGVRRCLANARVHCLGVVPGGGGYALRISRASCENSEESAPRNAR